MKDFTCVIMAGGAGTRFWPLSHQKLPKQFLTLVGETSLLQESYRRARTCCPPERILVFTHQDYLPIVQEQLPELPGANLFGEPSRRDTAAAVAWATLVCQRRFGSDVIVTLTADHDIRPLENFTAALRDFAWGAENSGGLYTMGIQPVWPATGYGYLELGERLYEERPLPHFRLQRFKEKPDLATAQGYLESGRYLWNSGMFAWRGDVIVEQFRHHLPAHLDTLAPVCEARGSDLAEAFERLHKISIDFAILEKAPEVYCLRPDFAWSDLGGWLALEPFLAEVRGNHARGQCKPWEAHGNLVFCSDSSEEVALIGVEDLVVVRVPGKTLILPRHRNEDVKKLLEEYPELNRA